MRPAACAGTIAVAVAVPSGSAPPASTTNTGLPRSKVWPPTVWPAKLPLDSSHQFAFAGIADRFQFNVSPTWPAVSPVRTTVSVFCCGTGSSA